MRRFEFVEGGSSKFWEITLEGSSSTTHWGRIGTAGQSTTKSFANDAAAKKEHDKLVAEKLGKGYREVGAPAAAAPKEKAELLPARTGGGIRRDVYLSNDGGGFAILSAGAVDRAVKDGRANDRKLVEAHDVLLVGLTGDDSFIARVVAGEPLTPPEEEEWIARIRWPLVVSGGKLLICSGYDPDLLASWREKDVEVVGECVREVAVPDGKYLASVYAYLHTMNGRVFCEERFGEKLGAWFRRDHEKRAFPSWVAGELSRSPEDDPGHEKLWEKLAASVEKKKLAVETDPLDWVGFLIHLQPFDAKAQISELSEDGWFPPDTGLRKPARFPLGIPAVGAEDGEVRYELNKILPQSMKKRPPPRKVETVDVHARVKDRVLAPVKGGAVEHPVVKLDQIYRLAWLATDAADPEIRITLGDPAWRIPWEPPVDGAAVEPIDGGFRIGFEFSGAKWAQMSAVRKVAERLASLPDGATLELMTAPEPDAKQHRDFGVHRYRGSVTKGVWKIAATYPALDRALLREAVDFSVAIDENGQELPLRDAAEGQKALELSHDDRALFHRNPIVVKKSTIGLTEKNDGLLHFVATYVFRTRWADVWPCTVPPPEDVAAEREARAKLDEASEKLAVQLTKMAAPRGAREPIFEGKVGRFEKIDLKKERPAEREIVDGADRQLEALGYVLLGDLVCSRFEDVLVRGYECGDTWGLLMCGVLQSSFDFVTRFKDGSVLTTTMTDGASKDEPRKGIHRSRFPKLGLDEIGKLHEKHEKRKEALEKKCGGRVRTESTLAALAQAIDYGVSKQLGL